MMTLYLHFLLSYRPGGVIALINHSDDKAEGSTDREYFLGISSAIARERYGDDLKRTGEFAIKWNRERVVIIVH